MIGNLKQTYENSVIRACGAYITTHQAIASTNQRVTQYATDSFASLQQQVTDTRESIKNIFTQIYNHPLTPYVTAGLLGIATGSLFGLPLATSFILGTSAKLVAEGLDYGLQKINSAVTRSMHYLGCTNEVQIPAPWKETATILPIALGSFSLGLHSHSIALAAKLTSILGIAIIGSFALGSSIRG